MRGWAPAAHILHAMAQLTRRFHLLSAVRPSSVRIAPDAARALVTDGALLIDVRRQDDDTAKLDGALRITPDVIPERIAEFPRDVPIVLACT
jgi:rhodanese-related sulfurtransferase